MRLLAFGLILLFTRTNIWAWQMQPSHVALAATSGSTQPYSCPYCPLAKSDFSGRDLTDANLAGADLSSTNFSGAILNGAVLTGANLAGANFANAQLNPSSRGPANLSRANLSDAIFTGAQLKGANLQYTLLAGADFSGVNLTTVSFGPHIRAGRSNQRKTSFRNAGLPKGFPVDHENMDVTAVKWSPKQTRSRKSLSSSIWSVTCGSADLSQITTAVYVSTSGTDSKTCGQTYASACQTIAVGIQNCAPTGCGVLVSYGEYDLTTTLNLRNSVNVYGGCTPASEANSEYQSLIQAAPGGAPAIFASSITGKTLLQGFDILGSQGAPSAGNLGISLTLLASNSPALSILDSNIVAAEGAPGAPGTPGSTTNCNVPGGGGANNMLSPHSPYDCPVTPNCFGSCSGSSGAAGDTGYSASGGGPGTPLCSNYECVNPGGAQSGGGGQGGNAAFCGNKGTASSDTFGTLGPSTGWPIPWVASVGGNATAGQNGGGGGGGGSGGFTVSHCPEMAAPKTRPLGDSGNYPGYPLMGGAGEDHWLDGAHGGTGGNGGCAGAAGSGGTQGAPSLAIVAVDSTINFSGSYVIGGRGGTGGSGGSGGAAGSGGSGHGGQWGWYGQSVPVGGGGGNGGAGGAGGGGAGGNGGPSEAVVLFDNSSVSGQVTYYTGAGGTAGNYGSGGIAASQGCTGANGDTGLAGTTGNVWPPKVSY